MVAAIDPANVHPHFLLCMVNTPPITASASIAIPGIAMINSSNKEILKGDIPSVNGIKIVRPINTNNNTARPRPPATMSRTLATVGF